MPNLGKLVLLAACAIVPGGLILQAPERRVLVRLRAPVELVTATGERGYLREGALLCVHGPWFPLESGEHHRLDVEVPKNVPVLTDATHGKESLMMRSTGK